MELKLRLSTLLLCTLSMVLMFPSTANSDPVKIDFNNCQPSVYPAGPGPNPPTETLQCCPIKPTKPVVDGLPRLLSKKIRVRKASQCTDAAYAAKLDKAYTLMRALPADDPRSFEQQWTLHCSYCGGAFLVSNGSGGSVGVDIHFSWLFYPWHRYFLFFHERILQTLLGDPTFSLSFWNWDNPFTVSDGSSRRFGGACLTSGDDFPEAFSDSSKAQYDVNRSTAAKGLARLRFPDVTFNPFLTAAQQPLYNASAQDLIASNLNVIYQALVSGGTTPETFLGRPYRAGDLRGNPSATGGAGSLEFSAHAGVHFWTGEEIPSGLDMGQLARSARDPVFFAHHSNIDRLWQVWKSIGPILGQNRQDYTDPDFLNAEFQFYDENKDLRRVYVRDALDTRNLGYVYQLANDAAWLFLNASRCSKLSYEETIAQAGLLPVPQKDWGYYKLQSGTPFVIVIDRQDNPHGLEEFLTIDGIKLDRSRNAGFDVFVDLVYPGNFTAPSKCAEYSGRFTNMAQSHHAHDGDHSLVWKQSISQTLVNIQAPLAPAKLVVTLVPLSKRWDSETTKFTSISVTTY